MTHRWPTWRKGRTEEDRKRKSVKVAVGGAAVTPEWARDIGAEGYSDNAVEAVQLLKKVVALVE